MGHLLPVTPADTPLPGEVYQVATVKIYLPHSLFALAHWASFPNLIRFFKFGAHQCCGPGTLGPQELGGFCPG